MASSLLKVEARRGLYYYKYKYRATLHLLGLNRTHGVNVLRFLRRIETLLTEKDNWTWQTHNKKDIYMFDIDSLIRWIEWRDSYRTKPATMLVRVQGSTATVFSNDIDVLQSLELIDPDNEPVTYAQADDSMPKGVMLFARQPKHQYRIYLKACEAPLTFRSTLAELIDRYKNTTSELYPCPALKKWIWSTKTTWRSKYCNGSFFIEYDQDSTYMVLHLMLDNMITKRFELMKRT